MKKMAPHFIHFGALACLLSCTFILPVHAVPTLVDSINKDQLAGIKTNHISSIVATNGTLLISDQSNTIFEWQQGSTPTVFQKGTEKQRFSSAMRIRKDQYVLTDNRNSKLLISKNREWQSFSAEGSQEGEIDDPRASAWFNQNIIYVADNGNKRISAFTSEGLFLFTFGDNADEINKIQNLNNIIDIAVDQQGLVYVLDDASGGRISIYSALGKLKTSVAKKELKRLNKDSMHIVAMTVRPDGILIFADKKSGRIFELDWQEMKILSSFGTVGRARGQLQRVSSLSLDQDGKLYIADQGNEKIEIFQLDWRKSPWTKLDADRLSIHSSSVLMSGCDISYIHAPEQMLCINTKANQVTLRSHDGVILQTLNAKFKHPSRAAFDQQEILVLDNDNIKVFDMSGKEKFRIGSSGRRDGEFLKPSNILLTPSTIYVTDTGNRRIQLFSRNGQFQKVIGGKKGKASVLKEPTATAVDPQGNVYIADKTLNKVFVYSAKGTLITTLGAPTDHHDEFKLIHDLFVDAHGFLYVMTEMENNPLSIWVYKDTSLVYRFSPRLQTAVGGFDMHWSQPFHAPIDATVPSITAAAALSLQSTTPLTIDPTNELFVSKSGFFNDASWIFNRIPNNPDAVAILDLSNRARHTFTIATAPNLIRNMSINGDLTTANIKWTAESKAFSGYYSLYGRNDIAVPFELIQHVVAPHLSLSREQHNYTEYRVSAVSALGKSGKLSPVYQDDFWLGHLAFQQAQYTQALDLLKQSTSNNPQHISAWLYLGKTQVALEAFDDANNTFIQLANFEGWKKKSIHLQASALMKKRAWLDVKSLVDDAESKGLADATLYSLAADALSQLDDMPSAIYYLNQAIALEPASPIWHLALAEANYSLGATKNGQDELLAATQLANTNSQAWLSIARAYKKHGLDTDAITSYERVLSLEHQHTQALPELATLHLNKENFAQARSLATQMSNIDTLKSTSYYILGRIALAEKKAPQALAMLAKAGQTDPNNAGIWLAMANAYADLNKPDREVEYLQKSIKIDNNNFDIHMRLALSCTTANGKTCAEKHYAQAVLIDNNNVPAKLGLAKALIKKGKMADASQQAQAALQLEPNSINAHLLLAEAQSKRGMIPVSIATLKRALLIDESNMQVHLNLSKAYIANQMYTEASEVTENAILLDVLNPQPVMLNGNIHLARQSFDEAIASFEKAVALAPNETKYTKQLNMAYLQKKRSVDAGGSLLGPKLKTPKFSRVFSAAYKQYADAPVGTVTLTNEAGVDYSNIKVSLYVKEYMDFPTTAVIDALPAGGQIDVPLLASFNNKILSIDQDTGVQTEIRAEYYLSGKPHTEILNESMTIYGKNTIVWDKLDMVGSFATPKDDTLAVFIRQLVNTYKQKKGAVNENVSKAMTVYNGLSAYGIKYLIDPNSPYDKLTKSQLDTIQFPRETLRQRSGDCDDLSILLSASLANLGIETAILDVPAHLLMMFNTGVPEAQKDTISLNQEALAILNGQVWIPLEATLIASSFSEAWAEGAKKYHQYGKQAKMKIMPMSTAWSSYPPVTLPPADYSLSIPSSEEIGDKIRKEWEILSVKALEYQVSPYRVMLALDSNNIEAQMQIAVVFARNGLFEQATFELENIRAKDPDNVAALNNLGNIHYMHQDYKNALLMYQKAFETEPNNADIKVNIAMVNYKMGDALQAKSLFDEAAVIDDQVPVRYPQLSFLLHQ
ncbi:MAG: tetratricopeptide repeat protein [Ghiorsea sp.]